METRSLLAKSKVMRENHQKFVKLGGNFEIQTTEGYLHRVPEEHYHRHLSEWDITNPVLTDQNGQKFDFQHKGTALAF